MRVAFAFAIVVGCIGTLIGCGDAFVMETAGPLTADGDAAAPPIDSPLHDDGGDEHAGHDARAGDALADSDSLVDADAAATTEPPPNGLVGYWSFDDVGTAARDTSGNHNDGEVSSGAVQVPGKVGLAYMFDGASCVRVPNSQSLELSGGSTLTMMAWVTVSPCPQPDSAYVNRGTIIGKTGEYEHSVSCGASPNYQEAIATMEDRNWVTLGGYPVSTIAWHHVATTWDSQTVSQYVDGALVGSRPLSGHLSATAVFGVADGIGIGCGNVDGDGAASSGAYWFVGGIDEVAVYNRALSAADIQTYYLATK